MLDCLIYRTASSFWAVSSLSTKLSHPSVLPLHLAHGTLKACITHMNGCYHALLQTPYFKGDALTQWGPSKEGTPVLVQNPRDMRKQFKEQSQHKSWRKDVPAHCRCSIFIEWMNKRVIIALFIRSCQLEESTHASGVTCSSRSSNIISKAEISVH